MPFFRSRGLSFSEEKEESDTDGSPEYGAVDR